jgi:uncharacterized protein (DUF885 family)
VAAGSPSEGPCRPTSLEAVAAMGYERGHRGHMPAFANILAGTAIAECTMTCAGERLRELNDEFFYAMHSSDPLAATLLGVSGYDALLPDPSQEAAQRSAARFQVIESELAAMPSEALSFQDATNRAVMTQLAWSLRTNLEDGIWATDASAVGYISPPAMALQSIPTAPLDTGAAVSGYLQRLAQLPDFFDGVLFRYRQTLAAGGRSTAVGLRQAMDQLRGHLGRQVQQDRLLAPLLKPGPASAQDGMTAQELLTERVRPAMARLLRGMEEDLLAKARGDDEVGLCFTPGGAEAYQRAVRRHTTTDLTADEIHQVGLDVLRDLEPEWEELGSRVFGQVRAHELRYRLREEPALRFSTEAEIVRAVAGALTRAEAAKDGYFPPFDIADCVVEEIDPAEARNAALAYYRGPSENGRRPGALCVLTADPRSRFVYEYEALAFHESIPGHHLQIAVAQTLSHLPLYRRHLDAEVCAYVEGWGLYCERLADEMGLYTSDLQRLGMLSFDAVRACRLVVDTGIHHLGWSHHQAVDFMWQNTATAMANVHNEIDRYIAWPGQALAYMIGRREIRRLREVAESALGDRFDLRGFHGAVLGEGAVPLPVLAQVVERWQAARIADFRAPSLEPGSP